MIDKIKVKPKDGIIVKHPESGNQIYSGQTVFKTPQILRYINDGDLIIIQAKKTSKKVSK